MIHEIFPVGPLQCNCSVIADETTHEAMVIDPGDQIDRILCNPAEAKAHVKQIVITHAHIDHVGGAMKLKAATGAPILINKRRCHRRCWTFRRLGGNAVPGSSQGG